MSGTWTKIGALLSGGLLLGLAACGGGGEADDSVRQPGGDSRLYVSDVSAVLDASAQSFQERVDSFRGELTMDVGTDDQSFSVNGNFAYAAPDSVHLTMQLDGGDGAAADLLGELGDIEVLLLGDDLYVFTPFFDEWVTMSVADLGLDAEAYDALRSQGAPFDYGELIDTFGDSVKFIGAEEIDGQRANHYQVTVDRDDVMDVFAEAFSTAGSEAPPHAGGSIQMDVWLGEDDYLPYQITAKGDAAVEGGAATLYMSVRFFDYNEPVEIPGAPDDAVSLGDLFADGGIFGEGADD